MNAPTKPPLVLHVSAAPRVLDLAAAALRGAGFEVLQATDGPTGLAIARQVVPDLVLLDVRVPCLEPGLDGYELTRRLRADEATAGIPIVHTSSDFPVRPRQESFDAGADAYLTPTFEAADVIEIVRPLARLRAAEVAASRRAEALRVASEKKDEFIATLGHELRNPLGAVRTGLTLLETCTHDAERSARIRATVARQTESLVRLVDDLLDVASIEQGKLRLEILPVDLREVVLRSVDFARPSFERMGVSLRVEVGTACALIDGDASRLEQIVANLLDNALKYTPAGGRVEVSVAVVEGAGLARLRIEDTGVGIHREHLEKGLFRLFSQGDTSRARRAGGLGIGLSVVHRLVEVHGGTATVRSAGPGLGTEVTIELPLIPVPAAIVASGEGIGDRATQPEAPPVSGVSRRVLLVDDHADSTELFQEVLQREGHAVAVASSGEQAVEMLLAEVFDVALVDIGLPGLDGYGVARLARERLDEATPLLVAMTGYGGAREREAAARAGFDVYLVKPVDAATLVTAVAASPASTADRGRAGGA